jgi:hypothetical protein
MEIQKFLSHDAIRAIPGYLDCISRVETRRPILLGYYRFKDFIHCARSECNRQHGFGYVVRIDSNEVIGIGNRCGAKLFGDQVWRTAATGFAKQIRRHELRESLSKQLAELPSVIDRIEKLIYGPRGAKWLENARNSLVTMCPVRVLRSLELRVSQGNAEIVVAREIDNENDTRLGFRRDSEYATDVIGRFAGLGALASPSPRILLVEQLRDPLRTYIGTSADDLMGRRSRLRYFQDLQASLEGKLRTAERRLEEARLFFTTRNLRLLAHLATSSMDRAFLERVIWNEAEGFVETR